MNTSFFHHLRSPACGIMAAAFLLCAGNAQATTRTVSTLSDSGPGSLRQAIADSNNSGDTINFSVIGTIALTSGPLNISKNLTITGPGARNLNVSGTTASVFTTLTVFSGTSTISGLTIGPGRAGFTLGNAGTALTMNDCAISGNSIDGGIFTNPSTTLHLNRCTISDNHVGSGGMYGAGIINEGTATLTNCTISGNSYGVGAGVWNITGGTHDDGELHRDRQHGEQRRWRSAEYRAGR